MFLKELHFRLHDTIFYGSNLIFLYKISIILLFGQQTKPTRPLSRSKNSHVNQRKKEKLKLPTTAITEKLA